MNIKKLNLNLLLTLDALLSERSVTRAGEKLFITQSATSNALNQLRDWLGDELLVRSGKEMLLTPYANSIKHELNQCLLQLQALVEQQPCFDAASSTRIFNIGMTDFTEFFLMPYLLQRLQKTAPNVELRVTHINHLQNEKVFLDDTLELVVGAAIDPNPNILTQKCAKLGGTVIGRTHHPLLKKPITLKQYLSAKHIRIYYKQHSTNVDSALTKLGKQRDVRISLPHIIPALFMLQKSDLLASIPDFMTPALAKKLRLAYQPFPIPVKQLGICMGWHKPKDQEPGLLWLKDEVQCCMQTAIAEMPGLKLP